MTVTIRNANENYGDPQTFTGDTLADAVATMQATIRDCGPEFAGVVVSEHDYEVALTERAGLLPIDRDSLAAVLRELIVDDSRPMNPVLAYDSESGEFSIESDLTPYGDSEYRIATLTGDTWISENRIVTLTGDTWIEADADEARTRIAAACESLRDKMADEDVAQSMAGMDDAYIRRYVIGDPARD
jgi:hypothetical protein